MNGLEKILVTKVVPISAGSTLKGMNHRNIRPCIQSISPY
jgi:hypothetical protein